MVKITETSHKATIANNKEERTVEVDFSKSLDKNETAIIKFQVNNITGEEQIAFSVGCGACTKVNHIYKDDKVVGGEIEFTPRSKGIHRKSVYVYKNKKLVERIILKAQI